jgi:hypothetical protein
MSTTDEANTAEQPADVAPARDTDIGALRRSALIRVAVAVLAAGGATAIAIASLWGPLRVKANIIGYPVFADFNPYNYSNAYYLVVGLFPVAALLLFAGLTRVAPKLGLATPSARGRIRPLTRESEADAALDGQTVAGTSSQTKRGVVAAARVAFVGAVLGLEIGIASNHLWASVAAVASGYVVAICLGSFSLGRLDPTGWTLERRIAAGNAMGASLAVAGLAFVSAHTEVHVLADHSVQHYSWFPVWVALLLCAVLLGWTAVALRRAGAAGAAAVERRALLLIAAPVALLVLIAHLPGDLGQLNLYEVGQWLTETRLLGHGWFPWRDVELAHGLLSDVLPVALGSAVFGSSFWGTTAAFAFLLLPLSVLAMYYLLAYLVGSNWTLVVVSALIFMGTWLGATDLRFLLWPLVLLLLASLLKRPAPTRAIALAALAVIQAIVAPEMAPVAVFVFLALAAYEWYWRRPNTTLAQAFRRTTWYGGTAIVLCAVFAIYLASQGALRDAISDEIKLATSRTLDASISPALNPGPSQVKFDVIVFAPVAALLISVAYAAVRLRLRRPFLLADWPMGVVALFVLTYYSKFLTRMEIGHAYEPFMVATPLMVYIVYRAVTTLERWVRRRLEGTRVGTITAHPVGLALLIFTVAWFWGTLHTQVASAPASYRPAVAARPAFARVGYDAAFDGPAFEDLRRIINAYLRPRDRMLDLTDEPALFYYFIGRDPSSRFFAPDSQVELPALQRDLLDQLRRSPPKLIVVDDTDQTMIGYPNVDGVPVMARLYLISRWILDHYRPLLESHGRIIYALPGLPSLSSLHLRLHQQPTTTELPFRGQQCNWAYAPTFLSEPAAPPSDAHAVPARTVVPQSLVTFTGWAGDLRTREPARAVVATFNDRIVGSATPNINRPDVPAAGYPPGFANSGFRLSIPTWANASESLRLFAIGRDGSVAELATLNRPARGGVARIGSRTVRLQPTADIGHVEAESASTAVLQIKPPAGSTWSDYRWLEVDAPPYGGFLKGPFDLSDRPGASDPGRVISFQTLERSPRRYIIPVSSCPQWRGYGSSRLLVTAPPGQQLAGVRLIR